MGTDGKVDMKRFIALMLVGLMLVSVVAAADGQTDSTPSEGVTASGQAETSAPVEGAVADSGQGKGKDAKPD